jgi:cytochrome c biogenesis protein CcmG, thiol:disulfide interchange protein DsbE
LIMSEGQKDSKATLPQWTALVPVGILAIVMGFFAIGLTRDPHALPTMMVDRPMPEFELQPLADNIPNLTSDKLKGQVTLVNVFGSWCVSCVAEHPMLMNLSESGLATIHGVDWRDEASAGREWLDRYGNPYTTVGLDADSRLAINLGVTGAPETFVVDRDGRVRYKQVGPITQDIWDDTLEPLIRSLEEQAQ